MRIQRILSFLNITGFRKYAIELVKFLEKEIYGENGYLEFILDDSDLKSKFKDLNSPLKLLAKHDVLLIIYFKNL